MGKGNNNSSGGVGGHGSSVRGRTSRCPRTMSDMNASAENLGQYQPFDIRVLVFSVNIIIISGQFSHLIYIG